ncbi:MAG: DUF5132 domain-containing protein [Deltaproteobacteria bacterium]|nr:DUF5132 domain-containing protein [Deltaproteobacteria bacterium]
MARDDGDSGRNAERRHMEHREIHASAARQQGQQLIGRSMLTTGALIGVAALIEPELLIGMAVGAGIAMASNWLPDLVTGTVHPLVKTAIKAGYAAATMTREIVSEASESVQDMVAEVRAERGSTQ